MLKMKTNNDPVAEEKLAEQESEVLAHHGTEPSAEEAATSPDEEAQKSAEVAEMTDTDEVMPAEIAAIHEVIEPESKLERKKAKKVERKTARESKPEKSKSKKTGHRSAKYLEAKKLLEAGKLYPLTDAIELVRKLSLSKFDGAIELHLRLTAKKAKGSTESQRGIFHLPHGTGKDKKIVVLDEKAIEEIAKTKKINFDIAIASPELMPKVAKIAKILGPRGLMPDPKSGTVTNDPKHVMDEISSGKTQYRVDASNNVHQTIGRVSWETDKLTENAKVVLAVFPKTRLASAHLGASIGPAIPLELK